MMKSILKKVIAFNINILFSSNDPNKYDVIVYLLHRKVNKYKALEFVIQKKIISKLMI
ncbi:MAG: hypothetical protein O7C56_02170 [Rickettsia endosymbiont of Ixodes persulcatus]|nr:hypothetical protein [Rickettsia endosymbiont of Ixodes persulcatus]